MKRLFEHKFFRNKWVVPVSALVLTLCIGSFALAGTGTQGTTPTTAGAFPAFTPLTPSTGFAATTTTLAAFEYPTVVSTDATGPDAADLQAQQAKENAILDLIREKMTPQDQATFDQLRAIAVQQQLDLSRAQAYLESTKAQIMALVDKYLGMQNPFATEPMGQTTATPSTVKGNIPVQ